MTGIRFLVLVVAGAVTLGAPTPVDAQGQGRGPAAQLTVSPADVVFPSPSELDFDMGWVDHTGVAITIEPRNRNRQNWQLYVQASAADMGGYGKPVQDIMVRVEGSGSWIPVSTTAQMIAEGTGTATVTIYYRLLLDWSLDAPGSYSVPLEYDSSTF